MLNDKKAWLEAISDTAIGTVINFPLNILAMMVIFKVNMNAFQASLFLWFIFTTLAVVRKYIIRRYFKNKSKNNS